ncbi:uncharacterized protein LOC128378671 [Scomber japonicus]|uniref:uncharacterized protein LOC128378671 n=1 Tax=Scomber japonicus TaxID=13676 RepID=UPI002305BFDE|nr:uncharacterized protein LOC128378671 [Scomber japonicus]
MADAVGAAAGIVGAAASIGGAIAEIAPTHRQCTIEIMNECKDFSLCNPRMFFESGGCAIPLLSFIGPYKTDVAQFIKTPHTACGSVGVFTYDLLKKDAEQPIEKIAVMFSVPYDFGPYKNLYALLDYSASQLFGIVCHGKLYQ